MFYGADNLFLPDCGNGGCETKFFFWWGRPAGTPGRLGEASLPRCTKNFVSHPDADTLCD